MAMLSTPPRRLGAAAEAGGQRVATSGRPVATTPQTRYVAQIEEENVHLRRRREGSQGEHCAGENYRV